MDREPHGFIDHRTDVQEGGVMPRFSILILFLSLALQGCVAGINIGEELGSADPSTIRARLSYLPPSPQKSVARSPLSADLTRPILMFESVQKVEVELDSTEAPPFPYSIIVEAIIDEEGKVTQLKVLRGYDNAELAGAAREAVMGWMFEPATLNGKPVAVYYNLSLQFRVI